MPIPMILKGYDNTSLFICLPRAVFSHSISSRFHRRRTIGFAFFLLHDRMIAMNPYAYYSIWMVNGMLYES